MVNINLKYIFQDNMNVKYILGYMNVKNILEDINVKYFLGYINIFLRI